MNTTSLCCEGRIAPVLTDYDIVLLNLSGGKDSQAMAHVVARAAEAVGVDDRLVAVHADLGDVEWPGVPALATEHARHYGIPLHIVARRRADGTIETILDRVLEGKRWPSSRARWCTSDHKRGPIRKLMTALVAQERDSGRVVGRPVRLLNILGMRAAESRARAQQAAFKHDPVASNGRRHVDQWLPLHNWSTQQVWECIRLAGTRPHPAYLAGMSRLSCRFCVLASASDLRCSAQLNPQLAQQYAEAEQRAQHLFQHRRSITDFITSTQGSIDFRL